MTTKKTQAEPPATLVIEVHEPSPEAQEIVSGVIRRGLREHEFARYERMVFETPGVLEGFDAALDELEALKRSM